MRSRFSTVIIVAGAAKLRRCNSILSLPPVFLWLSCVARHHQEISLRISEQCIVRREGKPRRRRRLTAQRREQRRRHAHWISESVFAPPLLPPFSESFSLPLCALAVRASREHASDQRSTTLSPRGRGEARAKEQANCNGEARSWVCVVCFFFSLHLHPFLCLLPALFAFQNTHTHTHTHDPISLHYTEGEIRVSPFL